MRRGAVLTLLAAALPMALGGCQGMPAEAPVREQAAKAQPVSAPAPAALPDTTPEQVRDDYDEVLRRPIQRVTTPDVNIPFAPALEKPLYPSAARIAAAARRIL